MRILILSHVYSPSVGGVEAVGEILAREFVAAGHDVKVVTHTPGLSDDERPEIIRRPSLWTLARLVKWSDVVLHNNISLRTAWPLILFRRPWVVGHHIWLTRPTGGSAWQDRLKRYVLRFGRHVAPSRAIASALPVPCVVVRNPYRDDVFVERVDIERSRDLVFVGRLVSDKGADLLIDALAELRRRNLRPSLTIVGSGPEEARLRALIEERGVSGQVEFAGLLTGDKLARELNAHAVMVVPSRWQEPFGIVALEGIACGCVVVASSGGGLPDAVGPCGVMCDVGSVTSLARGIEQVLADPILRSTCRAGASGHLAQHRMKNVSAAYLRVLESVLQN